MNSPHDIVHMYPTPPLLSRSDPSAQPEFERRQHTPERSALRTKHQPNPDVHRADACFGRNPAGVLPLAANLGQKSLPTRALFAQKFVAAIPVEPDRRCTYEHGRLDLGLGQRRREVPRSLYAALADRLFLFLGPATHNALPSQVDYRIEPRHLRWR